MDTLAGIVLGFLVVSAGVAALARSTTARWEREARRAAVHPPGGEGAPAHRHRVAVRLGRALGGAAATARPVAEPVRELIATTGRRLTALRQRVGEAAGTRDEPPRPPAPRRRVRSAAVRSRPESAGVPRRTRRPTGWGLRLPTRSRARRPSDEQSGPPS
jgi:hypothetical protein